MVIPAGSRLAPRPDDGAHWHAVVDLRALDTPVVAGPDVVGEASTLCAQAVDLIRTLAEAGATPRVWLVTKGAQPIADRSEPIAVAQAPIWGLGRVIALEHPELWGGLVDLDPAETVAAAAEHVVESVLDADEEDQAAYRDGRRYVPRLMRAAHRPENRVAVHPDGAYLVSGGLGGLGLQVARWLVDQGARHLVLLGRHGLDGAGLSAEDAARRTAAVADLRSRRTQVDVVVADVADRAAMTALLASFGAGRPPLRGIVHAAAQVRDEALLDTSAEVLASVMGPKAAGG